MKPKLTFDDCSETARRKARLTIIMREVAGEQMSLPAAPGQSASLTHHRPVSAHILAGCPAVQKSPDIAAPQEASPEEEHVVLAVITPCLHEPHGVPEAVMHDSYRRRPDPSMVEIARQKSPLILLHIVSEAQAIPPVSLQKPLVVGVSALQSSGSVAALDPHA
jgi:hypothetical protein